MDNRLRISFSTAKAWWDGKKDEAIKMMLHEEIALPVQYQGELDRIRAMSFGRGFHKCLELESNITGVLPAMFGVKIDHGVIATELKMTKEIPTGDTLVGVIDAVAIVPEKEMTILCDYKTGLSYNDMQFSVYQYLVRDNPVWNAAIGNIYPTHGMALCLDKKTEEVHNTIIQLSYPSKSEDWDMPDATTYTHAINWLCTICEDIRADSLAMAKLGMIV